MTTYQPYNTQQQPAGSPVYGANAAYYEQQPSCASPVGYGNVNDDGRPGYAQDPRFRHSGLHDAEVVQGIPLYPDCNHEASKRFVKTGYRDVPAAILFILMVVVSVGFAVYNAKDLASDSDNRSIHLSSNGKKSLELVRDWGFIAFIIAVFAGFGMLGWMRAAPKQFIVVSNVLLVLMTVAIGVYAIYLKLYIMGAIWIFCAALSGLFLYLVRHRIPFAAVLLGTSVTLVTRHKGTIVVSFGGLFTMAAYYVAWCLMAAPLVNKFNEDDDGRVDVPVWVGFAALGLLIALLWVSQVVINVVHVTVAGVVATWYYMGEAAMPSNPSTASLGRAMTTSFGSICFGSLLVAIIKAIHYLARQANRSNNDFASCIAACIIGIIERLLEYFNVYAFTFVAIYGSSYVEAAKQTWELVKRCGWAAYFNDCLVWPVLSLSALFPAVAIGAAFGLATWNVMVGIICFFIAYVTLMLIIRPVYSGVVTQFVCVAENPDVMQSTNPQYYAELEAAM